MSDQPFQPLNPPATPTTHAADTALKFTPDEQSRWINCDRIIDSDLFSFAAREAPDAWSPEQALQWCATAAFLFTCHDCGPLANAIAAETNGIIAFLHRADEPDARAGHALIYHAAISQPPYAIDVLGRHLLDDALAHFAAAVGPASIRLHEPNYMLMLRDDHDELIAIGAGLPWFPRPDHIPKTPFAELSKLVTARAERSGLVFNR